MCGCLTNATGQEEPADSGMHCSTASPSEASDKLIPQISPPGKKYSLLLHHVHMSRCSQPTAPLSASQKSQMKPASAQKSYRQE